jgi:hypothetical protein
MATVMENPALRAAYKAARHKGHRRSATSSSNYHTDVTHFHEESND